MNLSPNFIFKHKLGDDSLEFPLFVYLSGDYVVFFSLADNDIIGALEKRLFPLLESPTYMKTKSIYHCPSKNEDLRKVLACLEEGKFRIELLEFIMSPEAKSYKKTSSLKDSIISFLNSN